MVFADRLRQAMEARELTQGQLEIAAAVSQGHISMILNEKRIPAIDIAMRLALALGVSIDWLCGLPVRDPGALSHDETMLLESYRAIPDERGRQLALDYVHLASTIERRR